MLTFTFTDGRTDQAEDLYAFMERHFPPGLEVDAAWTGHVDGAALLLLPRDPDHIATMATADAETFDAALTDARAHVTT